MKYKIITKDALDIAKRLKRIDSNYIIKRNLKEKRYEIFYKESSKHILQLVVPYAELDYRTLEFVLNSRIENLDKLIKKLEKQNYKQEKDAKKKVLDEAQFKVKEMANYISSKGDNSNLDFADSYKTKWV